MREGELAEDSRCCSNVEAIEDVCGLMVCKNCGMVDGYKVGIEYIDFYVNMYRVKKISIYIRKYQVDKLWRLALF